MNNPVSTLNILLRRLSQFNETLLFPCVLKNFQMQLIMLISNV